jgi:hypothetical protein
MNVYGSSDADQDEAFAQELKNSRVRISRQVRLARAGRTPKRPVLIGRLDELDVRKRGIRRIW